MTPTKEQIIETFITLGQLLTDFGNEPRSQRATERAINANPWFTREDIARSVMATRSQMLSRNKLTEWLSHYKIEQHKSASIGVIMAGNIPLVGLFDMLCVLICGHTCIIKPSSKDSVLIEYICELLREIDPNIALQTMHNQPLDGVIATGSDNTNRYFKEQYRNTPSLLRCSRASMAVLSGGESSEQLELLAQDIFEYSGLGCRNVSKIFVPQGYSVSQLCAALSIGNGVVNPRYRNNYLQHKALLSMSGEKFIDGNFFIMRSSQMFPVAISEITYTFYDNPNQVKEWIEANDSSIQCIVGENITHSRVVAFGQAQHPTLADYPDGRDVVKFLQSLV